MAAAAALTASWLAARWGLDPIAIEAGRRAGELYAVRADGDWFYPAWQFDESGAVRPEVARVLSAARQAGLRPEEVTAVLGRRSGLAGGRTMLDSLREGDPTPALAAIAQRR
jgi:hypothetical protein